MPIETLNEKCGIFGIFDPEQKLDVARISFYGLFALQHRGQEGSGIAVSDGEKIKFQKGMGLVNQVYTEEDI